MKENNLPDVDWLANVIRSVDGNHTLGAGALAEKIVEAIAADRAKREGMSLTEQQIDEALCARAFSPTLMTCTELKRLAGPHIHTLDAREVFKELLANAPQVPEERNG